MFDIVRLRIMLTRSQIALLLLRVLYLVGLFGSDKPESTKKLN